MQADGHLGAGVAARPARQGPGGEYPAASLGERVMVALPTAPGILGPCRAAERVEHRTHRGGCVGCQVTVQRGGAAEGDPEPDVAVARCRTGSAVWADPLVDRGGD